MRWLRVTVIAGFVLKAVLLGAWWWTSVARAERPAPADAGVTADLFAKSRGFRELLEAVRQRGEELDRREQELVARETALRTLEQTVADAVARPEAPGGAVQAAASPAGCGVAVTKVYQSMRAEEAAPIMDRLDDATAKTIFGCMKEKQVGAILAAMKPDRAVALTKALAGS
jgi:flagellar motility protein MotE (MotC chaperone)